MLIYEPEFKLKCVCKPVNKISNNFIMYGNYQLHHQNDSKLRLERK
jgi:hypothetical protein